jgi:hypothetical protein
MRAMCSQLQAAMTATDEVSSGRMFCMYGRRELGRYKTRRVWFMWHRLGPIIPGRARTVLGDATGGDGRRLVEGCVRLN